MMSQSKLKFIKELSTVSLFILLLVILNGCNGLRVGNDFLEKPPGEDVTLDTIFSRATAAKEFLWHTYETLPFGLPLYPKIGNGSRSYDNNVLYGDVLACLTDINQSFDNNGGHRFYYAGN